VRREGSRIVNCTDVVSIGMHAYQVAFYQLSHGIQPCFQLNQRTRNPRPFGVTLNTREAESVLLPRFRLTNGRIRTIE